MNKSEVLLTEKKKDYFSSREAAELLGVAVSTIQLWTDNGLLRAWTTGGGHRRIACSSVEEMLSKQQEAANERSHDSHLSILVVEDDTQQRRLYEKQLSAMEKNAYITMAKDGYEALIRIGQTLPDVIISDLVMPNIDGFKMVKVLREIPELESCLVVVVSGLDEDEVLQRGGLPEDVHFFKKPVPLDKIGDLIKKKIKSVHVQ
jgi:excisionase family DNA binding protein